MGTRFVIAENIANSHGEAIEYMCNVHLLII
jgi:hypothetical protein